MTEQQADTAHAETEEARAIAEAEKDVAAGRLVPHALVVRWMRSWGKPEETARPTQHQE